MRIILALVFAACQPKPAPQTDWQHEIMLIEGQRHTWVLAPMFRGIPTAVIDARLAQFAADDAMLVSFPSPPFGDR